MMIKSVHAWKQSGNVYLWRYHESYRNYPGWHLSADHTGAESLLNLITELKEAFTTVYRTITLSEPTNEVLAVPNNRGGKARWWAPSRLKIIFDPAPVAENTWSFPTDQDPAVLTVGREFLMKLQAGIHDVSRNKGDYSIGGGTKEERSEATCLWFW